MNFLSPSFQIGLIQFCISPPKSDLENNVVVSDYTQMDRVYKEERNYILGIVKKIKATGCNVLLIQKSILRDAVTDLALHYLVRGREKSERGQTFCCITYAHGIEGDGEMTFGLVLLYLRIKCRGRGSTFFCITW